MTVISKNKLKILEDKDLFEHLDHGTTLAHGVNCAGAMGKGIALEFKNRWSKMYEEYHLRCKEGRLILGQAWLWEHNSPYVNLNGRYDMRADLRIFNLAIKSHWRNPASYLAVEASVNEMLDYLAANNGGVVAMPWIGCGLGGLDKKHITKILKRCLSKSRQGGEYLQIWIYEGKSSR